MFIDKESGKIFSVSSKLIINATEQQVFLLAQLRPVFFCILLGLYPGVFWLHCFLKWLFSLQTECLNVSKKISTREYSKKYQKKFYHKCCIVIELTSFTKNT